MAYSLTPRQREIIEVLRDNGDLTNQQLADYLGISIFTVKKHKVDMYQELGVTSTLGLVMKAMKENLV